MTNVIETPRLALREIVGDDLDFLAAMLAHPEVMRYYPKRYTRAEAQQWLERQQRRYERDGHGLWIAVERATGSPVGQIGVVLQHVSDAPEREVGYLLHHPYWRRGYATEAARACRDWVFATYDAPRVISLIRPENTPSRAVAERMGMRATTIVTHAGLPHRLYAVTRDGAANEADGAGRAESGPPISERGADDRTSAEGGPP